MLAVVLALGAFAMLVTPQLASASHKAARAELTSELQLIRSQIDLFRVDHDGHLPHEVPSARLLESDEQYGWGVLVSDRYLLRPPVNPFAHSLLLTDHAESSLPAAWRYSTDPLSPGYGAVRPASAHISTEATPCDDDNP